MIPRIVVDLEPGAALGKVLQGIDLLDIAYGATRGGARGLLLPIGAIGRTPLHSIEDFDRRGLPTLTVKCAESELDRAAGLGAGPERILVTGERGTPLKDFGKLSDYANRGAGAGPEIAALIDPEPSALKSAAKAGARWVYFPTNSVYDSKSTEEAAAERARIESTATAASRLNLRVAVIGPTGRHLPAALAAIEVVEEVIPTPDLWLLALRVGWENAVNEFIQLSR